MLRVLFLIAGLSRPERPRRSVGPGRGLSWRAEMEVKKGLWSLNDS